MVNPGTEAIPQTFQELIQSVKAERYNITFFRYSDECRYFDLCLIQTLFKRTIIKNDVIEIFHENIKKHKEWGWHPIEKVLKGTHAVLATRQGIELSMTRREKENVFVSDDILFTKFHFIQMNLVKVNYAVEISKTVNLIAQSGLPEKIHRNILDEKARSDVFYNEHTIDTNNEEPLDMDDIMGLLYLLVAGYLISFVVFLTEILVNKLKKIRKKCRVIMLNLLK
ncbi:uncharacterized protein [Centruroides vittatus]|uniref:uncharacterized protein n=1 Tax=Centruroides vittatus TaxID=120091 RepID=UPI00350ECB86